MCCRKGFKNVNISTGLFFFSKDVVSYQQCCLQKNFCNARYDQFVCTHRRSYDTSSIEKEQSLMKA